MKKLLISLPVIAALGGCSVTNPFNNQPVDIASIIAGVQQAASIECGFVPVEGTIVSIINAGVGTSFTAIADLVCGALKPKTASARRGAGTPVVVINGQAIPVNGYFVR